STFGGCSSPKTYSGLHDGTHTFEVAAQTGKGPLSPPASFTWTVDTQLTPVVTLSFPANSGGVYGGDSWNGGCSPSPAGFCGTASDFGGLQSVRVSIQQGGTNNFWNGSAFVNSKQPIWNTIPESGQQVDWTYGFA